jgi:hypothetical protein
MFLGTRIITPHHKHHRLGLHQLRVQIRNGKRRPNQGHIYPALIKSRRHIAGIHLVDLYVHLREVLAKTIHMPGHTGIGTAGRQGYAQHTGFAPMHLLYRLQGLLQLVADQAQAALQFRSRRRQLHRTCGADKQGRPYLFFQPAYGLTQGRLGHEQTLGCPAKVQLFGHHQEHLA